MLDLNDWIEKRALSKSVLGRSLSAAEKQIVDHVLGLAEEISPNVIYRTPTVIGAVALGTVKHREQNDVPPEVYIPQLAEQFAELEAQYLAAGRGVSKIRRKLGRAKARVKGLLSRVRG